MNHSSLNSRIPRGERLSRLVLDALLDDTESRLEEGIRRYPARWSGTRDAKGNLVSAVDRDAGRIWVRCTDDEWISVD